MNTVSFAIVGCGRISISHIEAIKKAPSAHLTAICDINESAARLACEKTGLQRFYTDLDDMLLNEKIDVLCVCTPSGLHAEHTIIAARHGVNVLCEKPLDITAEKMEMMISECRRQGVLLGGIYQRRNSRIAQVVKECLSEGKLGKLMMADAYLKYYRSPEYYAGDDWRGTWALDGGGCLMNQGIHGIDLLMQIAGDIESVNAKCITRGRDIEVEDIACAVVRFKNGAIGVIEGSTCVDPGQDTVLCIQGDKGSIVFGDKGFYIWKLTDESPMPDIAPGELGGINCGWAGHELHAVSVEDMAQAVINKGTPMITGEDARRAVDVILAIYESSRTGKEVLV